MVYLIPLDELLVAMIKCQFIVSAFNWMPANL